MGAGVARTGEACLARTSIRTRRIPPAGTGPSTGTPFAVQAELVGAGLRPAPTRCGERPRNSRNPPVPGPSCQLGPDPVTHRTGDACVAPTRPPRLAPSLTRTHRVRTLGIVTPVKTGVHGFARAIPKIANPLGARFDRRPRLCYSVLTTEHCMTVVPRCPDARGVKGEVRWGAPRRTESGAVPQL